MDFMEQALEAKKRNRLIKEQLEKEQNEMFKPDTTPKTKVIDVTPKPKEIIQEGTNESIDFNTTSFPIQEVTSKALTFEEKKQTLRERIDLYKFMINEILDREKDYYVYKNGKEHITRSGCIKLATAFDLSIEPLTIEIEREYDKKGNEIEIHAHARCKVIRPNGSFVIGTGSKSKSEYYSERFNNYGSYNIHNLRTTAMTKASNHGIIDAIGFAMVTYEEIEGDPENPKEESDGMF